MARSRARARELVVGGQVSLDGSIVTKASQAVRPEQRIVVTSDAPEWVGRGALKLIAALDAWAVPVAGRRCLDIGASTGGFTQVLLERGATHVVALDVGHDQLHPMLSADPRVTRMDGTSIRDAGPVDLGGRFGVIVADLSFISLTLVLARIAALLIEPEPPHGPAGDAVLLVKPQFEVGRQRLGRRGIVTRPEHRRAAVWQVLEAARSAGLHPHGIMRSPVQGGTGNTEYLLWLRQMPSARMGELEVSELVTSLTEEGAP